MTDRAALERQLNQWLEPARFKDYGPNGLQVEGRAEVNRLVCGVTASLALIDAAIEAQADAILVHHGLFWRGQDGRVTGWMKQRLSRLIQHDINLCSPTTCRWTPTRSWATTHSLASAWDGRQTRALVSRTLASSAKAATADHAGLLLAAQLRALTGRDPVTMVEGDGRPLRRIAWCTGGAQGYFRGGHSSAGADVFITGEISEPQAHYARETGVAFVAAGHHATERYGVQGIGRSSVAA